MNLDEHGSPDEASLMSARPERAAAGLYGRFVDLTTVIGAATLTVLAAAVLALLGGKLRDDWRAFPQFLDWTWLLVDAAVLAAAAAGLLIMLRLPRHNLLVGLLLATGLRAAAVLLVDAPLDRDWQQYHQIAVRISQGGDIWSNIPTGYSLALAILYRLFGPEPAVAQFANIGFGVATAALVYCLTGRIFGRRAASVALYLIAIAPDQVLMTPVLATEHLYTLLLMVAVAAVFLPRLVGAIIGGLALGASQYVRTTTMLVMPAFLAVWPLLAAWRNRLIAFAFCLAIALAPAVFHNRVAYGEWTISTSRRGAWSLLVGTNQKYSGQFNLEDVGPPGSQDWSDEAARAAQAEAIRRITSDPMGFAALAVRKVFSYSASGDYAVWIAMPTAAQAVRSGLSFISQAVYAVIMVLALAAAWRFRRNAIVVLSLWTMTILAATHAVLEVSPRYHASIVPLLCVLAGAQAAAWSTQRGDMGTRDTSLPGENTVT